MSTTSEATSKRRWYSRRPPEDRALTSDNVPAVMLPGGTLAGPELSARRALAVADVYSCVRAIVDAASTLPLIAYARADGGRERFDGELAALLARPAPAVPAYAFLGHLFGSLVLHGDGFIAKYRDDQDRISQLGVLDPTCVRVEVKAGLPLYIIHGPNGAPQTVTERDVLHVRSPLTLDGVRGLSPLGAARAAFDVAGALGDHAKATLDNGGRPSGVLTVAEQPGRDDLMKNLASAWSARHSGPSNAGKVAVLAGEVQFQALAINASDLEFVEQRRLSTAEIARVFRIPPWVIGAPSGDSLTYSTVEAQGLAFVTYSLRPWLAAVEQSFSADPDLCPPGVYVEFLLDGLLRADHKTRADVYTQALDPAKGWMTRDEVRSRENLPKEQA